MAQYQSRVNGGISEDSNYGVPSSINRRVSENEENAGVCATHIYKGILEGDTSVEYKAPLNVYQAVQGVILNNPSLNRVEETLEIGRYAKYCAPPNLCILTSKEDTFSENHMPSKVYIGTLEGDKITEYQVTPNVYKIISDEHKVDKYTQTPPTKQFQELKISQYPTSSIENAVMPEDTAAFGRNGKPIEINNNEYEISNNIISEEPDIFTLSALEPWGATEDGQISERPNSKNKTNEDDSSQRQSKRAKPSKPIEDEFTCVKDDCKCGDNVSCRCPTMRGKYYDYYQHMKEKEYFTMYPKGKCILPKGTVLHFTGAPKNMMREDLWEPFEKLGAKIEFIDYQKGNEDGWVRLSFSYEARKIIKKMTDKKLKICDAELVFRVLSGKEEKRYLKKVIDEIYKVQEKGKCLGKLLQKNGFKYVKNIN